ncbi:DASH complex subunit [Trichinella spiralis]|uniref:DASH complex subunit n=1 Tax=Trichinella spiralis TaxID=6334 RepID=A0ABR3KLR6_TRISP
MAKVKSKPSEKLIDLVKDSKSQFPTDLCMTFIDAGIPLWKLENKSLRGFLEKYTKQHIPSESSLQKNYIDNNFNNVMDRIRRKVAYNKTWVSIDEMIDPVRRFVANVVIGTLEADQLSKESEVGSAVFYYAVNFTKIQEIIGCFEEEEESTAVKIVREIMQKESILCDLVFIASNIEILVQAITFLEKRPSETLVDKLRVFDKVIDDIYKIPGKVDKDIQRKCDKLI